LLVEEFKNNQQHTVPGERYAVLPLLSTGCDAFLTLDWRKMSRRVIETVIIETPASEPIWGVKGNGVRVGGAPTTSGGYYLLLSHNPLSYTFADSPFTNT
jgi:hypothetical protein